MKLCRFKLYQEGAKGLPTRFNLAVCLVENAEVARGAAGDLFTVSAVTQAVCSWFSRARYADLKVDNQKDIAYRGFNGSQLR